MPLFKPVEVQPLECYRLRLRFEDDVEGEVDLDPDALYLQLTGKTLEQAVADAAQHA
jgi:hypothetical protein